MTSTKSACPGQNQHGRHLDCPGSRRELRVASLPRDREPREVRATDQAIRPQSRPALRTAAWDTSVPAPAVKGDIP
jgi:hypothetical protein